MKIVLDESDLRPLIERVVVETLGQFEATRAKFGDRLAFPEAEAASLLGVPRHVLRDARLRGEIDGAKIGKRIVYRTEELLRFLASNRI